MGGAPWLLQFPSTGHQHGQLLRKATLSVNFVPKAGALVKFSVAFLWTKMDRLEEFQAPSALFCTNLKKTPVLSTPLAPGTIARCDFLLSPLGAPS
jgi:hypothetical protein